MTTKQAVEKLAKELLEDQGYWISWQANIAMAFLDECDISGIKLPQLHEIANQAANNFLKRLTAPRSGDET